jgi:hypothetical protein
MKARNVLCVLCVAAIGSGAAVAPAWAQTPEENASVIQFDAADQDGDGTVDEAEMAGDTAAGFAGLDKNGDGYLVPGELGPHDTAAFKKVDTNGDGRLSFKEVMDNKLKVFKEADTNRDGVLELDEVITYDAAHEDRTDG